MRTLYGFLQFEKTKNMYKSLIQHISIDESKMFHVKVILFGILIIFTVFIANLPHRDYLYPVHIDEWVHYNHSQEMQYVGLTLYSHPLYGDGNNKFMEKVNTDGIVTKHREVGFHIFLSQFQLISGIEWITIFRLGPTAFSLIFVLACFYLGGIKRWGFEAAFLAALLPTTNGLLGLGFLVPVAWGMFMVPILLKICHDFEFSYRSIPFLWMLMFYVMITHPASTFYLTFILGIHSIIFVLNGPGFWSNRVIRIIALGSLPGIGWLGFLKWTGNMENFTDFRVINAIFFADTAEVHDPIYQEIFLLYGIFPTLLFLCSVLIMTMSRDWKLNALVFSAIGMFLLMFLHIEGIFLSHQVLARRGWHFLMIIMVFGGAYFLFALRNYQISNSMKASLRPGAINGVKYFIRFSALILIVLVLFRGVEQRMDESFYRMLTDKYYEDALWIRNHVGNDYDGCRVSRWSEGLCLPLRDGRILVDPVYSLAISTMSGKYTYSNSSDVWFDSYERIMTSKEMIREGYRNVIWFDQNKVNIIYRPSSWSHPYFHKPRQDIFVTNEFYEINDGNE